MTRSASGAIAGLALLTAMVVGGCSNATAGAPAPVVASSPSTSAASAPTAPSAAACQLTVGGGAISINGGGGRVVTTNGVSSFSCRSGSLVTVEGADQGGVRFTVDGASVTAPIGVATPVGPYQITVSNVVGEKATFQVVPPA